MTKNKTNYLSKIIGIGGLIFSVILIVYFSVFTDLLTNFTKNYISTDHQIEKGGIYAIKMVISLFLIFTICTSIIFVFSINIWDKLQKIISVFIDIEEVKSYFLKDDLCNKKKLPAYLLVIGTSLAIFLFLFFLTFGQPEQEGYMEEYSSSLFLFSAIVLLISCFQLFRLDIQTFSRNKILFFLILLSGLFIILFGEEISWGQRIFGWSSTGIFKEVNNQRETNFHNFFNALMIYFYPFVGISSFLFIFLAWFFPKQNRTYLIDLLVPPPSLFFLLFIMACSTFNGESEIYEELLAIFLFLYSLRIFMCLRYPNVEFYVREEYSA